MRRQETFEARTLCFDKVGVDCLGGHGFKRQMVKIATLGVPHSSNHLLLCGNVWHLCSPKTFYSSFFLPRISRNFAMRSFAS